jgi:hypothetical protein
MAGNSVIHISDEAHAMLTDYCKRNKIAAASFVSGIVTNEVKRQREEQRRQAFTFRTPADG